MTSKDDFFNWSDDYNVNVKGLDEQHQELVDILNRLFVAVSRQEGKKAIIGTLDALLKYAEKHFALEEYLMQQANYSNIEVHKAEHRKLIEHLDQLCDKHSLEEKPIYFEMLNFLKSWFKDHILGVDMQYSEFLQQSGHSIAA